MSWDVIIVGAGSAGCVLADQLSSDGVDVLLVEAGPDYGDAPPPSVRQLSSGILPEHDWDPKVEGERDYPYPRGRLVGGSSAINGAIALQPPDADLNWGPGWTSAELRPALEQVAHRLGVMSTPDSEFTAVHQAFVQAAEQHGHARTDRLGATPGVAAIPRNRKALDRWSAADAFLHPARSRPNLEVRGDTLVQRIAHRNGQITGVETAAGLLEASTVISSGGVFESPRLLFRSGLGRPNLGENMSDHLMVPLPFDHAPELREPNEPTLQTMLQYATPYAPAGVSDMQIFPAWSNNGSALVFYVVLQVVAGRGRVTPDLVEWPFASHPENVATLRLGLEHALELAATESMAALATPHVDLIGADLHQWIASRHANWGHGCGTCALGLQLDDRAQFADVAGLYVIDASMIPTVPSVNPNLTVMAAALRAAQLLTT